MIWIVVIALILTLAGIAYLKGKCDGFIAGYNTMSPEKRRLYDIRRVRLVVACFHFGLAALFFLFLIKDSDLAATVFFSSVVALSLAAIVLCNTWAKKKAR